MENFRTPSGNYGNTQDSDVSGDESRTPKDEKMDIDDPGSAGRTTRGKRPERFLQEVSVEEVKVYAKHLLSEFFSSQTLHPRAKHGIHLATSNRRNQQAHPVVIIPIPTPLMLQISPCTLRTMSRARLCL